MAAREAARRARRAGVDAIHALQPARPCALWRAVLIPRHGTTERWTTDAGDAAAATGAPPEVRFRSAAAVCSLCPQRHSALSSTQALSLRQHTLSAALCLRQHTLSAALCLRQHTLPFGGAVAPGLQRRTRGPVHAAGRGAVRPHRSLSVSDRRQRAARAANSGVAPPCPMTR